MEGRTRRAQEALSTLKEQAPLKDDPDLPLLERQVRGQLGKAELVLTGNGSVTINGKTLVAPHRLHVPAGLCLIDGQRTELRDGERREIAVH